MNVDIGFFMSPDTLEILNKKARRLSLDIMTARENAVKIGSIVTLIDCQDSHIHTFRLVESARLPDSEHNDVSVDSTLGIALLGSRVGDYMNFSLGGEEGRTVILRIDNKN